MDDLNNHESIAPTVKRSEAPTNPSTMDQSIQEGEKEKKTRKRIRSRRGGKEKRAESENIPTSHSKDRANVNINEKQASSVVCENVKTVDIKIKINRLKGKLEKFSSKCVTVNRRADLNMTTEEGSYCKERKRKPRTNSERLTEPLDMKVNRTQARSLSFSASSTSSNIQGVEKILSEQQSASSSKATGATDPKLVKNQVKSDNRTAKKKQRDKRRAIKKALWDHLDQNSPEKNEDFVLDSLSFFLLDLLITPPDKWEHLITLEARNRGLILSSNEFWILNPKLAQWTASPFRRAYDEILEMYSRSPLAGKCFINLPVEEPKVTTFEDLVNSVVQEGLSEEQKKEFSLPVTSKEKRKVNYFKDEEFEKNLEAFAQKCVEANLGVIVESEVRISAKNNFQAFISLRESERDAMVPSQLLRKFALQGDIVRAFVRHPVEEEAGDEQKPQVPIEEETPPLDDSVDIIEEEPLIVGKSSKAFVIKIAKEVNNRLVVGTFLSYRKNAKYITFVPRDIRMPNVRIYQKNWPESFKQGKMEGVTDTLYVAEITSWEDDICIGTIKQPIGKCGDLDSENRAILLKNNLKSEPFDEKFNELYSGEFIISEEEIKKREDLRKECIFTIDPLTAKDLDDAMSIKELPDGNFEIGVHISDVGFFLDEDCELDQLVKKRTTSVYMVNEVFHMLPKPLCFRCSLLPGEDKLSFSVFWTMSPYAEILTTRFARSVMRSCTQLAYQHAQMIIDNPEREFTDADFPMIHNGFGAVDIVRRVKQLNKLAEIMRANRFENGALRIDRPKIYFDLDPETGAPVAYRKQEQLTANFLIEEFMLLANQSVAKFIYEKFPNISILRNHQPPIKNVLKRVKDKLFNAGLVIDVSSSKSIHNSLARLISESENPDSASICLSQLVSKPMTRAKYFCTDDVDYELFKHYALSIPIYTHFTSPIRRYPDVLVHRTLAAALSYAPVPKRTPSELKTLTQCCNDDKYNAKLAGDDSSNLYLLHYIQTKGSVVMKAVIIEVYNYSFEAILIETGTLLLISWKNCNQVKVSVTNENGAYKASVIYPTLGNKEVEMKLCTEIWLKVTVKSMRLRGEIVPHPTAKDEINSEPIEKTETTNVKTLEQNTTSTESAVREVEDLEECEDSERENETSDNELFDEAVLAAEKSDEEQSEVDSEPNREKKSSESQTHPLGATETITDSPNLGLPQALELARLLGLHTSHSNDARENKLGNKVAATSQQVKIQRIDDIQTVPEKKKDLVSDSNIGGDDDADIVIEEEEVITLPVAEQENSVVEIVKSIEKISLESVQTDEQTFESKLPAAESATNQNT